MVARSRLLARPGRVSPLLIALWAAWLAVLATLVWTANKGIELGDEGALLLGYKYPNETLNSPRHFSLLIDYVFGWARLGVVDLRLLKLLLDTGAAAAFAFGLAHWLWRVREERKGTGSRRRLFVLLFPLVATSNAFGYGVFGQTISYNSLNADALMTCYGLILLSVSGRGGSLLRDSALFLAGVCLGLDLFVKFPSSVAAIALCLLVVVCHGMRRLASTIARLALALLGYATGMGLFFFLILPANTWIENVRANVSAQSDSLHNPHFLLTQMWTSIGVLLIVVVPQIVVSGWLSYVLFRRVRQDGSRKGASIISALVLLLIGIAAVQETLLRDFGGPGRGTVLGFATVIAAVVGLGIVQTVTAGIGFGALKRQRHVAGVVTLMLFAPFVGAVGSNVPVLAAENQYMTFWTGAIATLLLMMPRRPWAGRVLSACWALPPVLVAAVLIQALFLHPWGIPTSLFAQTEALSSTGDLAGLRVDAGTAQFFRATRQLISTDPDYRPGTPIVSAYDLPGLVYVLGGVAPGAPWFFADEPEQPLNCIELRSTRLRDLDRSVVMVSPAIHPAFLRCLHSVGITFPTDYRLAGRVRNSYNGSIVAVYIPQRSLGGLIPRSRGPARTAQANR